LIRSGRVRGEAGRLAMVRALLSGEAVRRIIARTDGPRHRQTYASTTKNLIPKPCDVT
jgi:hypothetical protein